MSEVKGFVTPVGYMGNVDGCYQLFATESDYLDYVLAVDCDRYNVPVEEELEMRSSRLVTK